MFINPINLLASFVVNAIVAKGDSCTPIGYFGCDIDKCICDGCGNSNDICWNEDTCIYNDNSKGALKCHTIDNCMCVDKWGHAWDPDLTRCSACDSGPPVDTCTNQDKCTTGGATSDWVNCSFVDWACQGPRAGGVGYGPDVNTCPNPALDVCFNTHDLFG